MKIFTNKSIWQKVVIALLIILLFQAVVVKPVHADVVEFGGKLMSPFLSLLVTIGDAIMDTIGRAVMGAHSQLVEISMSGDFWDGLRTVIAWVVGAALALLLIVGTMGAAVAALAAIGITATVTVGMGTVIAVAGAGIISATYFNDECLPENMYLPIYTYSAEEIFKDNILLFNIDFFNESPEIHEHTDGDGKVDYYYYIDNDGKEVKTSKQDSAVMIRKTISSWYNALRNICLVLMLSVLVYIGIRMLLSTVASDKAKYLTMLKDWFVGLCLLFLMHYIMAFSVTLVGKLTDVVKTSVSEDQFFIEMISLEDSAKENKVRKVLEEEMNLNPDDYIKEDAGGGKYLYWPTNLMGKMRCELEMNQYGAHYVGLSICFIMLCLFTLYFTITYLKRVLHMAFLTLIAPLVSLTYCIDKLNDGQAQGFNKWLKEYIFNLLIQPMHLLLYYILVTSAFELAGQNIIYSIVAIGFMIPAEKLLRSLFGFEKAQTAPALGPAGAMMASSMLTSMLRKGPKGKGEGDGSKNSDSGSDKVPMPRESNPIDAFTDNQGQTEQQQMLDAYDEQYGPSGDWDPGERDAMAREAYKDDEGMNYSNEDYENIVRDSLGPDATDEDVQNALKEWYGIDNNADSEQQQPSSQPNEQVKEQHKPKMGAARRIKRTFDASLTAQRAAMRNAPRKFKRKLENAHPMRTVGRMAAGAVAATAAGAMGVAIAATTGDLGNVAKIGGGAIAGGYALGSGRAQSIKSPMQDETIRNIYDDAYNKGEKGKYKPDAMNDYVKNYLSNVENRNYFEQKFGKAEAKKMFEDGEIEKYLYNDISDKKEMAAMHKLQTKGVVKNTDEAIAISQLGQMIGENTNNMTTKKRNEWKTRIGDMATQSGVKDKEKFAADRLREIDKLHDFKK